MLKTFFINILLNEPIDIAVDLILKYNPKFSIKKPTLREKMTK